MKSKNIVVLHVTNLSKINCGASVSLLNGLRIVGKSIKQKAFLTKYGELADKIKKIISKEDLIIGLNDSSKKENYIRGHAKIREVKALRKAIKKLKPDVIHLNSLESFFPLGWVSVLSGIPTVGHQRELYCSKWDSFGLRFLKRIISISNFVENTLPLHLKCKSVNIYNPLHSTTKRNGNKVENRDKILYLGRITKEKGPDLVLDAFLNIHNSIDSRLVIAGFDETSSESFYANLLKQKWQALPNELKDRIELLNWTNNIEKLFSETCLLIVPSRVKEGLGRSALEAMSYGIPVIASNNGGLTEVVESNVTGYLYEPGNLKEL
jgi:glycosyltransferase involved in cell wall biosynthesis